MATAAYDHIEATGDVLIGGTLAFRKGDAIPLSTAEHYGFEGDTIQGLGAPGDEGFRDTAVVVNADGSTQTFQAKDPDASAEDAAPVQADAPADATPPAEVAPIKATAKPRGA